jgi:hypothetical protein
MAPTNAPSKSRRVCRTDLPSVCFKAFPNLDAATFARTGGRNNSHFGDARVNRAHLFLKTA